jgi:hypothetical protein
MVYTAIAGLDETARQTLSGIAHFFLRAKRWQIFVLLIGTQAAGFLGYIAAELTPQPSKSPLITALMANAFMLPSSLCCLAWWWSTGSLLHSLIKPTRELNVGLFRFSSIFGLLFSMMTPLFSLIPGPLNPFHFAAIAILFLFVLLLAFYIPFFLSRSLLIKTRGRIELGGGEVVFFFLFSFPLIGVWRIQPRINQLFAETQK